jgi:3-hydroxybutyryl-CoA dehydratase
MAKLENFTFDELEVGQKAEYSKHLSEDDVVLFAVVSGDVNPVHLDDGYARTTMFGERIAHGMYTGGLISAALAVKLPGPGTIYLGQNLKFERPVKLGDTITVHLTILEKIAGKNIVKVDTLATNQHGKNVVSGTATVMAPAAKVSMEVPDLPAISIQR